MYRLVITLQSDLCAADGDGFASTIDSDIVTDRKGIPFIPARRLKGCLLEAANYIGASHIEQIFGVTRAMTSGSLHITNAQIRDYAAFAAEADKRSLSPKEITEYFTSRIASTAIGEDGSVKDNTLRFLRAVSAGSFLAVKAEKPLTLPDTMYIGERQNAGFGAVRVFPSNALLANADNSLTAAAPEVQAVPAIVQWFDQLNKDEDMRAAAVEYAAKQAFHLEKTWNAAFLGRVTLMVKQSDSKSDLDKRIESIKSKPKREAARKMLDNANPEHYGTWDRRQQYLLTILSVLKYRIKQHELAKQGGAKA